MEFNPQGNVIRLCIQAMEREANGKPQEAGEMFMQGWNEAANELEKFITAYFVAQHENSTPGKLKWLETALGIALAINNDAVKPAFAPLYASIAQCYEDLRDRDNARKNRELASLAPDVPSDKGPFYHGTKADLPVGGFLTAGYGSNYKSELRMNHIYFTALANGAGLAAMLAKGDGRERVYLVEPTGSFENDPNVTNKKFPGNPTRSYRTEAPLKIIGEVADWAKQSPEELQKWREKLANANGEIIN